MRLKIEWPQVRVLLGEPQRLSPKTAIRSPKTRPPGPALAVAAALC